MTELEHLTIAPGEVVIFRAPKGVTREHVMLMADEFNRVLGNDRWCMVAHDVGIAVRTAEQEPA